MTKEALNIATQCRATAGHPSAQKMLVDGGNGLMSELLNDAARVIEALAQPEEPAVQECPNYEDCKGACFQCEYFNAETGMLEYPPLPLQEQLDKAYAAEDKAAADRDKAHAEIARIEKLIKEQSHD
jgi:hypothetical protein